MLDRQGQTVILAMYTFVVGPWLPQTGVISSGLIHKPGETGGRRRSDVMKLPFRHIRPLTANNNFMLDAV